MMILTNGRSSTHFRCFNGGCLFLLLMLSSLNISAQNVDLENVGTQVKKALTKKPFRLSGGISANSVFYSSNEASSRDPFTYFLNGNINLSFYNWSLPVTYSLTNQGSNLGYQVPYKFNRLSFHPKYKWIRAHIGDASMSFSPYTFSGLNFTGLGVELTPNTPFKIAVFGGQLNKAVEDDGNTATQPAFRRNGCGVDIKWEQERYKLEFIGFYAKDILNSLDSVPESKDVLPQENAVLSLKGTVNVLENLEVFGEFSHSGVTGDLRSETLEKSKDVTAMFLSENSSTEFYSAYNAGFNFKLNAGTIGFKYERIDPGYSTLGAYYFNNDFENLTLNTAFNLFQGKMSLATSIGRERDNLNKAKLKETSRWVGNVNINLRLTERLNLTTTYSNFTMFTNNQLNQFTTINDNPLEIQQPTDSINYKQISQNVNASLNYVLSKKENLTQSINCTYSMSDLVNKEDDVVHVGGVTRFHNANVNYALGFTKIKMNVAASVNYTNTYAASTTTTIWGPTLSVSKSFLKENKLRMNFGASYNQSKSTASKVNVCNLNLGVNFVPWKKHNFTTNIVQMFRSASGSTSSNLNELTATVGYAYSF